MSLQNSPTEVFSNRQLNYNCCLLMIGINAVAVIKNSEMCFLHSGAYFIVSLAEIRHYEVG